MLLGIIARDSKIILKNIAKNTCKGQYDNLKNLAGKIAIDHMNDMIILKILLGIIASDHKIISKVLLRIIASVLDYYLKNLAGIIASDS